jgi:hypothetical protein
MRPHRKFRTANFVIANGASQSNVIPIDDALSGCIFIPSAFTNVGGTNLLRFGVSNNFGLGGTALITLLPTTTLATAQSQQAAVSTAYNLPPDVFKFRYLRLDGVTNEGGARAVACLLKVDTGVGWDLVYAAIANGAAVSQTIDISRHRGGSVLVPAAITSSAMGFSISTDGNTFTALKTTADAAISQGIAVDRHVPIPDGAFGFPWLRLTTGSNEGAARQLLVSLKR